MDLVKQCETCDLFQRFTTVEAPLAQVELADTISCWHLDYIGPIGEAKTTIADNIGTKRHALHAVEYNTGFCIGLLCAGESVGYVYT
ncbi:hypothetical protein CANARDRAFT_29077 [[Candida] arabinofermentans NRRL YB-2248]|uniref:Uncharacterized protein n=1 Tax=[Candida] arabinofermentans NRRL YB-2248 TaxID=983967 RepID=A0A1E4SYK7_9ASCO|nr:hypothetical protein CANARDRAFT_29077 [[Candida] arabinofermentans NRRL YB-2248]